jgi:uncharacterized lipoprotein YbaY/heat shock protein HslJ
MTGEPEAQNSPGEQGNQANINNRWLVVAFVTITLFLVVIIAYAMLLAAGFITYPKTTQPGAFITITEPAHSARLDLTWAVSVRGEGGGLFEGNVVVQAMSAAGEVLAQEPTIINAPDAGTGGSGQWIVEMRIPAEPGSQGRIVAFSTSPADGSIVAMDQIDVGYGESPLREELISVEDHLWVLAAFNDRALILGAPITLQFDNFQASGFAGCNRYNTSYKRGSVELNFGLVTSTAKECELPEGILRQEAAYFDALEQVGAYRVENQQLNMFDRSENLLLVYDAVVMGNIHTSNEIDLPEESVLFVSLIDESLVDGEDQVIAEQVITRVPEFPLPFVVTYNPMEIVEHHSYIISVRIEDGSGNLLYNNPAAYHVVTRINPSMVDVLIEPVE